jgi:hypothetical protein
LIHSKILSGEDTVQPIERKRTLPIEEVGDVGLLEAGLQCQSRAREGAEFDTTESFKPEKLVEILEIHRGLLPVAIIITGCIVYEAHILL